ncbi:MAG TPA: glycosyltransferase [Gemmatimonadales bacterium]|nr:glycosyltransferase [Gemmatimonadales bacterium]
MDISLVISTRNRASQLEQALNSYARLQYEGAWELVIVDNGSSDATTQVLEAFGRSFSGHLRLLHHERPGLGGARNAGWRAARGSIVAFTDDDCYPREDYLSRIQSCFSDPRMGFAAGRVLLYDQLDYPVTIQLSDRRVEFPPKSYIAPGDIHGANFGFRRQALEAVGGFDERLGAGSKYHSAEDTDAVARVSAMGWWGVYDPAPTVLHHHRRRAPEQLRQLKKAHGIGAGAYFIKCLANPELRGKYLYRWPKAMMRSGLRRSLWQVVGAWRFLAAERTHK